jgi:hypothetical protein
MENHAEVIVDQRIECLANFYVSGSVAIGTVVEEKWQPSVTVSDESVGQWVIAQFVKAAKAYHCEAFVEPVGTGYVGLIKPIVPHMQAYVDAHLGVRRVALAEITEMLPLKQRRLGFCLQALKEAEALQVFVEQSALEIESKAVGGTGSVVGAGFAGGTESAVSDGATGGAGATGSADNTTVDREALKAELDADRDKARRNYDSKYKAWAEERASIPREQDLLDEITATAKKRAKDQNSADTDALLRLDNALTALRTFLGKLMDKSRVVADVVRKMGANGRDPYEEGDMRACLANLRERFSKGDELGVATTVMVGIREEQGAEALSVYLRRIEEFHQNLVRMDVQYITVGDLAAMIAISGMKEVHRKKFLDMETTLATTLEHLGDGSGDGFNDCGSTINGDDASSRRPAKTMFDKVRAFVRKDENEKVLLAKFKGTASQSAAVSAEAVLDRSKAEAASTREARKKVTEAQLAFATMLKKEDARKHLL